MCTRGTHPRAGELQLKNDELDYILDNSGAKLVFADADLLDAVAATTTGAGVQSKDFATLLESATATDTAPAGTGEFDVVDTDVAQLLYTSGTTSAPKGAIMTHRALVHEYMSALMSLDFAPTWPGSCTPCRSTIRPRCTSS